MFAAVLDTCVLWPSLQRDFLLSLAFEQVYRPVWGSVILDELQEQEESKLEQIGAPSASDRASRLVSTLRQAFSDAEVTELELVRAVGLPDPDDEHVVAAAILGRADVIVTHNLKDFPHAKLPGSLFVLPPDEFARDMVIAEPTRSCDALLSMAARRRNPATSPLDLLDLLGLRYNMYAVGRVLRPLIEQLGE